MGIPRFARDDHSASRLRRRLPERPAPDLGPASRRRRPASRSRATSPSVCAAKLASGEADVGLIPSIEYQRIPGLRVVPALGIAASSEVRSVLLVSDVSRERIRSVALDPASRTSAALTRILLQARLRPVPDYREGGGAGADARLIIGIPR